jgi:hypothetical protein
MPSARSLITAAILAISPAVTVTADQPDADHPATAAEAAKTIDLGTFPMMAGGKPTETRRLASLGYVAQGDPRGAYASQKTTLETRGWKELPGAYLGDQACSGWFGKDGFTVSVTTSPMNGAETTAMVNVRLMNLGNVPPDKLPVPPDAKPLYSFAGTTAYVIESPAKQAAEAVRALLAAQGWQPYGTAGDSQYFKKNAVKLTARCAVAPGQGGKTVIQLSSQLLSADLPAPPAFLRAAYADSTKTLSLDVDMTPDALANFYRDVLGKSGWKATTEKPVKDGFGLLMIFRNDAKDIAFLTMHRFEGELRAELKHQTGAEFDEEMQRAKAADAKRKAESERHVRAAAEESAKKRVRVSIAAPADAKDLKRSRDELAFKLPAGMARTAVEAIRADLLAKGWGVEATSLGQLTGDVRLSKKPGGILMIVYVDTGLEDAAVTISGFGTEIGAPAAK